VGHSSSILQIAIISNHKLRRFMPWKAARSCSSEHKHCCLAAKKTNDYQCIYNDLRLFFTTSRTPLPATLSKPDLRSQARNKVQSLVGIAYALYTLS
jgi:hypothetical protein